MAIVWPDALVTELAERRCIIVMGAGASMGSLGENGISHPPSWRDFLLRALDLVPQPTDQRHIRSLVRQNQYLDAAEILVACSDRADFSDYLRRTFIQPRYSSSEMHKIVLNIDPKIVVTTNYDEIYDHYCISGRAESGYNVCRYYEGFAVDNIRSRIRLIVKAHGCVSDTTKVILSRSSYYRARRDYVGFYSLLDALFLTNTLLFVGCSLTDPDIQLILENANIAVPSAHPHYALVEKTRHRYLVDAIKGTHNLSLLEYPKARHDIALESLRSLKDKVLSIRSLSA
jgi:hypothetical protein